MKTVATCSKVEEAHLVRGRLEAAGIPAFILFTRGRWRCRACGHLWKPEPRPLSCLAVLFPAFLVSALILTAGAVFLVYATPSSSNSSGHADSTL